MILNKQRLYEHYKEIQTVCFTDGVIMPDIFSPVPMEYRLTDEEKSNLKPSEKPNDIILKEQYMQRRKDEIDVLNGRHEKYSNIKELQEAELESFLSKYPQFQDIIADDK